LLAVGAVLLVEIPGRRTSFTKYDHGWPFAVLNRDYIRDPRLFGTGGLVLGTQMDSPLEADLLRRRQAAGWSLDGFPWSLESKMSPWSLANATTPNILAGVADATVALLLLLCFVRVQRNWRRRGRWFQFSLRTLLVAVVAVAFGCAWIVKLHGQRLAEEESTARLSADVGSFMVEYSTTSSAVPLGAKAEANGWNPPALLPESIVKIGGLAEQFRRVSSVNLVGWVGIRDVTAGRPEGEKIPPEPVPHDFASTDKITDATLDCLQSFTELRQLEIETTKVTETGLAKLSTLRDLADLTITGLTITNAGAANLAKIGSLRRLTLDKTSITDAGLDCLSNLRQLEELNLGSSRITAAGMTAFARIPRLTSLRLAKSPLSNDAVAAINSLTHLKQLTLSDCGINRLELHDLDELSSLDFSSDDPIVSLDNLPALEVLAINGTVGGQRLAPIRLAGVPTLRFVFLQGLRIDGPAWKQLLALERLESLYVSDVRFSALGTDLCWPPRLRELCVSGTDLNQLTIAEMLSLEELKVAANSDLGKATFRNLPALRKLAMEYDDKLANVRLEGATNLREFSVDMGAPKADFAGLSDCKAVEKVILSRMPVAPSTVADIGTLTNLRSLELSDAQLTDADLAKLAPLAGLRELEISGNNCTDAGLKYLDGMTQLAGANLGNQGISAAGLNSLKRRLPAANIYP